MVLKSLKISTMVAGAEVKSVVGISKPGMREVYFSFIFNWTFSCSSSQATFPSTICYFFFGDADKDRNTAVSCLRALLHQLFIAKPSLILHAMSEFRDEGPRFTEEFHTLRKILTTAATNPQCGNVICVIDGLDECEELSRSELIDSLVSFFADQGRVAPNRGFVKFIMTCRPYGFIKNRLHLHARGRFNSFNSSNHTLLDRFPPSR